MTDSVMFFFCLLDESRKLFVSDPFMLPSKKVTIVKWIDTILEAAIKSSPQTTPVKGRQITSSSYQSELREWLSFGRNLDDPDLLEYDEEEEYSCLNDNGLLVYRSTQMLDEESD
jgi:hypothetical protein